MKNIVLSLYLNFQLIQSQLNWSLVNCKLNLKLACDYFRISDSKIVLFNNLSDKENYFEMIDFDKSTDNFDVSKMFLPNFQT